MKEASSFGECVYAAMRASGVSVKRMSSLCGMKMAELHLTLKAVRPSLHLACRMAQALDMTIDEILAGWTGYIKEKRARIAWLYLRQVGAFKGDKGDSLLYQKTKLRHSFQKSECVFVQERSEDGVLPFQDRPEGREILKKIERFDILACSSLSIICPGKKDAIALCEILQEKRADLMVLNFWPRKFTSTSAMILGTWR